MGTAHRAVIRVLGMLLVVKGERLGDVLVSQTGLCDDVFATVPLLQAGNDDLARL